MIQRRGPQLSVSREEQFRLLYENHVEEVARYVSRRTSPNDVQDVVADTFLTAWRRIADLPQDPIPWLFVTARNLIANRRRSTERRQALSDKLAAGSMWLPEEPHQVDMTEVDQRLLAAIARLPEAEREAFMLVAWDGLDASRASRAAGCSAATFRMRLHRARRRLMREVVSYRPFTALTDVPTPVEESR